MRFGDDQKTADIIYHIEEGQPYTVESIEISGNAFFDEATLRQETKLGAGSLYSADRLEFDVKKIRGRYL